MVMIMTNYKNNIYRSNVGMLDTRQFGILQQYLEKVNEPERYAMLYRQLEKEIELEEAKEDDIDNDVDR